ncbi:MAG: O-antigen ligase family protein, partial [Candidatus Omnitrophota bacterium]|nr:O-antigen ligase family protein [Candidatus Omnitrophota bacterium]
LTIGLIASVVCIYFAGSRASFIGLFVLLIIFAMTKIKKMWLYIPILTGGYLVFIEPLRRYYEHRIYAIGIIGDSRMEFIKTFFDLLTRIPFGVGFGNSIDDKFNVIPAENIWFGLNSFYLHILTRIGVQGLVTFALMLFFIVRSLFDGIKYIEDPNVRYFVFGAACGIIVQQLNFMANNVYHVPGGMLNFWVMCGMLTVIINLYGQQGQGSS